MEPFRLILLMPTPLTVPVDSNAVSEEPVAVCPATDKDRTGRIKPQGNITSKYSQSTRMLIFIPHAMCLSPTGSTSSIAMLTSDDDKDVDGFVEVASSKKRQIRGLS